MKNISVKLILICLIAACSILIISCTKENQKVEIAAEIKCDTLYSEQNIRYLKDVKDFMEYFLLNKKQKAIFIDSLISPEKFAKISDRNTMSVKFGILCSDIAYSRLVGNKVQMPEYDKIFERYIKDLNIASFFKTDYNKYLDLLANREITDSVFTEFASKFRNDRYQLVESTLETDEDFIIYFTIGVAVEQAYLAIKSILADRPEGFIAEVNQHNRTSDKSKTYSIWKFLKVAYEHNCEEPNHKKYKDELSKLEECFKITLDRIENGKDYTLDDIKLLNNSFTNYRINLFNR